MSAETDETFLTVAEVAEWLKLNQQTVRNWIDQGSLPAVRVGRRVRIKRSDLEQILDAGYRDDRTGSATRPTTPSAEGFWSGEPVGMAEPGPAVAPLSPANDRPEEVNSTDARTARTTGESASGGKPEPIGSGEGDETEQ
jgi:excisionase family DNA binding protein